MSIEPFNKLVKLVARAFYDDFNARRRDNKPISRRCDNDYTGIAVVVLDALTRRQWVREKDLAKDLKMHLKHIRRTLRFLEEEKLVNREHREETAKGDKKTKLHTLSYCCLDYAQIHDVVRYRMLHMKKQLKDELDNKNTVQEYICSKCQRRYNALDANRLISTEDGLFHCERCNTELECGKLASQDNGDGGENTRRQCSEKLRDLLQKMEVELKPLTEQLSRVKDLESPYYGTLQAWELRASAVARARASNSDSSANYYSRSAQSGTPMPFLGETKVEVTFSGAEEKREMKSENAPMKVLPPWMIKEGMNLTNEQRGSVEQESKMEGTSASMDMKDEKKSINQEDDAKNLQDEYLKAYHAILLQRQKEEEATNREQINNISIDADVGPSCSRKRQHDDDDDNDDDDIWEETPTAGDAFKEGLNVEAAENSGDEDDYGSDWEEG